MTDLTSTDLELGEQCDIDKTLCACGSEPCSAFTQEKFALNNTKADEQRGSFVLLKWVIIDLL
jgi:hypothetical protein